MAIGDTSTKNKIVKLESVEFTENGLYVPKKGITGFGKVTVAVPPDAMKKPLYITPTATDNLNEIVWDEYSGPYNDLYTNAIGYKQQDSKVFDFSGNQLGTADTEGVITSTAGAVIGKVSGYTVIYNSENKVIGYSDDRNFAFDLTDTKIGTVKSTNEVVNAEGEIIGTRVKTQFIAYSTAEMQYAGVRDVKVRRIGSWIDSNISADNIRMGHTILGVTGNVIELLAQEKTVRPQATAQEVTPDNGYNGLSKVTIQAMNMQAKTGVAPRSYGYTVYADGGYDGMSSVSINAVTSDVDGNIQPENIRKGVSILGVIGTYEVVPVYENLSVSPSKQEQVFTPDEGVDGFDRVTVSAVTAAIDSNIKPENIKRDVEILGVIGNYRIENLQDKVVDPQQYAQNITFDSTLGYEGLGTVTVNPVTSSVDSNIRAGNIKKDVQILGVVGTYDPKPNIQNTVTVTPTTLKQSVTPDSGYDGLGQVDINAVTAAIDPNILAENIKKNITILGVTGTVEEGSVGNVQESKTVEPSAAGDINVNPDPTYDALLKVIVKAVTASIDPNIMPKNIRKNISILGVMGTMEEGGEQKWFDFRDMQSFSELNQDAYGEGGTEAIRMSSSKNNYSLEQFVNETFPSIGNINAVMFTQIFGYDDEEIIDDIAEQCYINFIGGSFYQEYDRITNIPDQLRYFYPLVNDSGINGLTIGLDEDDGSARTMKLYVLIDKSKINKPVPVLVNGLMDSGKLPEGYDEFRYVKDVEVPAHALYIPKTESIDVIHQVLKNEDAVLTRVVPTLNQPDVVEVSAYDLNYGEPDYETSITGLYKLDAKGNNASFDNRTTLLNSNINGGYIDLPTTFGKQNGSYYYFKFGMDKYSGNVYSPLVTCDGLFRLCVTKDGNYNRYYAAWRNSWSSATAGSDTYNSNCVMYTGNTYYYRVYVNNTSTQISWSADGSTWTNLGTVTTSYINPTTANQLRIHLGGEAGFYVYANGCYIEKDSSRLFSFIQDVDVKKTSHEIIPLDKDNLFVFRNESRVSYKYQGDEEIENTGFDEDKNCIDFGRNGWLDIKKGFEYKNSSWEIRLHFIPHATGASDGRYLASWWSDESAGRHNAVYVNTDNTIYMRLYDNPNQNPIANGTVISTRLVNETEYYIRFGWDLGFYYCYCARDIDFTDMVGSWTYANTRITYMSSQSNLMLGNAVKKLANGSHISLFLDEYSSVRMGSEIIWQPVTEKIHGNVLDYIDQGDAETLNSYLAKKDNHNVKNALNFGKPAIDENGALSQASQTRYIQSILEDFSTAKDFEIHAAFKLNETSSSYRTIISADNNAGFTMCITPNMKLEYNCGNGTNSWANGVISSETLETGIKYYAKVVKTGTTYALYHSKDKETWTSDGSFSYSTTIAGRHITIGRISYGEGFVNGEIYLQDTYVKTADGLWWQPEITNVSKKANGTIFYNTPLISNNEADFTTFVKQYVSTAQMFKPESNSWEISGKYKFNTLAVSGIFGTGYTGGESDYRISAILQTNGTIWLGLSSNGTAWDICNSTSTKALSANTWYNIKLSYDGSAYKLQVSTDGETWTDYITITSSTSIYDFENKVVFGTNPYSSNSNTNMTGQISLPNCYVKVNEQMLWTPSFQTVCDYNWIFSKNDNWEWPGLTNMGKKGIVNIDEHSIYEWQQQKLRWVGLKQFTFNLEDSDAILYTKVTEN